MAIHFVDALPTETITGKALVTSDAGTTEEVYLKDEVGHVFVAPVEEVPDGTSIHLVLKDGHDSWYVGTLHDGELIVAGA